jgi:hypothetical protein
MAHVAMQEADDTGTVVSWLEAVTDTDYPGATQARDVASGPPVEADSHRSMISAGRPHPGSGHSMMSMTTIPPRRCGFPAAGR